MTDHEYFNLLERGNIQQRAAAMIVNAVLEAPHHRQWYLDQALRLLAGDGYQELVKRFESHFGEKWDTGIAP